MAEHDLLRLILVEIVDMIENAIWPFVHSFNKSFYSSLTKPKLSYFYSTYKIKSTALLASWKRSCIFVDVLSFPEYSKYCL